MAKAGYFMKFKLLIWKNWLLQWNHKLQFILELFLPFLFVMILVILRYMVDASLESSITYAPVGIYSLSSLLNHLSTKLAALATGELGRFHKPLSLVRLSQSMVIPKTILPYSPKNPFIHQIMEKAAKSLQLTTTGFSDAYTLQHELQIDHYIAGVEFDDSLATLKKFPEKLIFALRFPGELRVSDPNLGYSWQTSRLYPLIPSAYPRNYNDTDGGTPVGYLREGFLPIQSAISLAFIQLSSKETDPIPPIQMRRFPYPPFIYDPLLEGLRTVVSLIIVLSFIYPCTYIVKYVAHEKEKQLKEVMKIMGLPNWIHWSAWFFKALVTLTSVSIMILFLLMTHWTKDVAVLTYSNWSAMMFFMLIYIITSITFCFMISVFFSKASTAAAVLGLIWFIAYLPYLMMIQSYSTLTWIQKILWCLICNTAVAFGLNIIVGFEGTGEGLQWTNIFTPVNSDDTLTLGAVMIMMLLSSVIYMLICLYVEQILPGEFGVAKKWYFPFTPKFWVGEKLYSGQKDFAISRRSRLNQDAFEAEPTKKFTGLQIINLRKRFGDFWAVKGVSLNLFEDEITVLLGHNGAGKTTTISMLTGIIKPTSGTAIISGYDILTDLEGARSSLGICPQYNVLFDDLSVANHIRFFCRLRGYPKDEIESEITKYLRLIDIEKKSETPASKLSGGMQRKLSMCCALCGGTKVVLCDEPSSGMDPAARRHMWNLLQTEKTGRTMLLTTHFMDEADVLGDRIAIMCGGELKCYGTSFFLKKKFGSGYQLTCIKREGCDVSKVTGVLRQFIPEIRVASDLGAELSYQLPYKYSNIFQEMLGVLENKSDDLSIDGYGISITSMEEVFLKVGAEVSSTSILKRTFDIYKDEDAESLYSNITFGKTIRKESKPNIIINQWQAMFLKKILYTWRTKMLFLLQHAVAVYFIVMAVIISRKAGFEKLPPLPIQLSKYDSAVTVLEVDPQATGVRLKIAQEYEKVAKSYGPNYKFESTHGEDFQSYITDLGKKHQVRINKRYLAAATINNEVITAWLNNQPLHTAPLTINMVFNAIARAFISPSASIEVINKPLARSTTARVNSMQSGESLGGQLASNICFCMSFVTSLYLLFLVKEKESKAKLLQFVGGVRVWIYWMTHLVWDMITYSITALVLICTLACFQEEYCSEFSELMDFLFLIIVFGFAALPLTYIFSSYFTEPASGFARVSTINIFLGMALYICIMVMSFPLFGTKPTADKLMWFFMLYPHFSLAMGINELFLGAVISDLCKTDAFTSLPVEERCRAVPECCKSITTFGWERPGILCEIVYMIFVGTACILILIAREYRWLRDVIINGKRRFKNRPIPPKDTEIDSDVAAEKSRIAKMTKEEITEQNLVLNRVTKYYDHFLAVNQISLCVQHNECFGLLGVNGAGKTTTFKMLTGDEKLTYGKAYVKGISVTKNMNKVYREIGYCPQFDALLEDLTGREVLRIFCLLKGVPRRRIKYLSDELASAFGFSKHMNKAVKKYSGGNKRKLSTALAVVGNPSVVYLDEPTTGMDPGARRRLWNVVCLVRDSGKAIVLTSHSMEECEALCTRLAIMVNGEFMCIGSIQHLKNKFSKGFILKIKVKSTAPQRKGKRQPKEPTQSTLPPDLPSSEAVTALILDDLLQSSVQTSGTSEVESEVKTSDVDDDDDEDDEDYGIPRFSDKLSPRSRVSLYREVYSNKVRTAIENEFPSARLKEYYQGMLTFNIPLNHVKWSEIFGFMEQNLSKLNIEDYAITQTTLEEIFLDFAKSQVDLRAHSKKKGCAACLKSK